jgi:hypothetical protein
MTRGHSNRECECIYLPLHVAYRYTVPLEVVHYLVEQWPAMARGHSNNECGSIASLACSMQIYGTAPSGSVLGGAMARGHEENE